MEGEPPVEGEPPLPIDVVPPVEGEPPMPIDVVPPVEGEPPLPIDVVPPVTTTEPPAATTAPPAGTLEFPPIALPPPTSELGVTLVTLLQPDKTPRGRTRRTQLEKFTALILFSKTISTVDLARTRQGAARRCSWRFCNFSPRPHVTRVMHTTQLLYSPDVFLHNPRTRPHHSSAPLRGQRPLAIGPKEGTVNDAQICRMLQPILKISTNGDYLGSSALITEYQRLAMN